MFRYGQKWKEGDFIGIHLDAWRGHLSFFHNLVPQGLAYTGLSGQINQLLTKLGMDILEFSKGNR